MADQQPNDDDQQLMTLYFQIGTGVLSALLLAFGIWGYMRGSDDVFAVGMASRVGVTLAVISLAMPQLLDLRRRLPTIVVAFTLVALFLISARGNVGKILIGILVLALAANSVLAWLASLSGKK